MDATNEKRIRVSEKCNISLGDEYCYLNWCLLKKTTGVNVFKVMCECFFVNRKVQVCIFEESNVGFEAEGNFKDKFRFR